MSPGHSTYLRILFLDDYLLSIRFYGCRLLLIFTCSQLWLLCIMATLHVETHPLPRARRASIQQDAIEQRPESNPYGGQPRAPPRKKFVLCFDGTGNKFSGTDSDSNILKIYRMLDRSDSSQFHYYQPGIGTYVTTDSLSQTSKIARVKSWYLKAKDSAIGISFDQHVMGGYKVKSPPSKDSQAQLSSTVLNEILQCRR
jgi:hypothetical protein